MINFMNNWVKNLSLALVFVSILEMILPNNKTKKYVKMIMGLYVLFCIIQPIVENKNKFIVDETLYNKYIEDTSAQVSQINQSSMDDRLNELYREKLQNDISEKLKLQGYDIEMCKINAHISEENSGIEKIKINIKSKIDNYQNTNELCIDDKQLENDYIENKIVTEIQKIQKVNIMTSKIENKNDNKKNNITKTDIKEIKEFLKNEYDVDEKCISIN